MKSSAVPAACRRRRDWLPMGRLGIAAVWRRRCRCSPAGYAVPTARGKRGQGHRMVPLPPLDSPKPSFALTHRRCAAKRELRGLGSGRRADFGTLSGPEVSLRGLPRITVRGHPVQSGSSPLRKAPLRSRVVPWSTKRPCGPLAFRRATAGSRVQRKVRGVKRGQETIGVLSPFAPAGGHRRLRRQTAAFPPVNTGSPEPPKAATSHAMSWRTSLVPGGPISPAAASRRNGGKFRACLR